MILERSCLKINIEMNLEQEVNKDKIIKTITSFEKRFSARGYNGRGQKSFDIIKGQFPIMISAPHAVNHFRKGIVKNAEVNTGGIARYLQKVTGCHLIYSTKQINKDPNYDEETQSEYKQALKQYVEDNEIQVLIELHGASKEREFAVEMGTVDDLDKSLHGYGFISDLIKAYFEYYFKDYQEKNDIWKNRLFQASNKNTMTNYISSATKTACIQLEINGEYRDLDNKEKVLSLTSAFKEIIEMLSNIDWQSEKITVFKLAQAAEHKPQDIIQASFSQDPVDTKRVISDTASIGIMGLNGEIERVCLKKCSEKTRRKYANLGQKFEEYIFLTNRLIEAIMGRTWILENESDSGVEGKPIIVYEKPRDEYEIGMPVAEKIDNITFSSKLYHKLEPFSKDYDFVLFNRYTNTRISIDYSKADYKDYGRVQKEKVMIPRYYKRLLGYLDFPLKNIRSKEYLSFMKELEESGVVLSEKISDYDQCYQYYKDEDYYDLKLNNNKEIESEFMEIQEKYFTKSIEVLLIHKCRQETKGNHEKMLSFISSIKRKLFKKYVDFSEVCLQTTWTKETDDKNNVARLSKNLMNLLGVSENDKIEVQYGGLVEKLRVLEIENGEDYHIGVPAPTRKRLGMNSTNGVVTVRRDMGYALQRHSAQQGVTFLGTILAVFQVVPKVSWSMVISALLFPLMLYWVLSEERVKVK